MSIIFADGYLFPNLSSQYCDLTSPTALTFPHHQLGHGNGHMPGTGAPTSPMVNGHGHHHLGPLGDSIPTSVIHQTPVTTSPSSSSSMEEFYLAELGFPPRIKKKSRKPKGIDNGPMKRKSREGMHSFKAMPESLFECENVRACA